MHLPFSPFYHLLILFKTSLTEVEYEIDIFKEETDAYFALGKKGPTTILEGQIYMRTLFYAHF